MIVPGSEEYGYGPCGLAELSLKPLDPGVVVVRGVCGPTGRRVRADRRRQDALDGGGHDRAARGERIGRGAGGGRAHDAVAAPAGQRAAVDLDVEAGAGEVQLRLKFNFRAQTPAGRVLVPTAELLLTRDMSYNERDALAKEQEEQLLYRAMQDDIAMQVLRRLAAVKP